MTTDNGREAIQLDETSRAWYAGVAAGSKISDEVRELGKDVEFARRLSMFWLKIGWMLKDQFPEASTQVQEQFIGGASLRQPEQRRAVEIVVGNLESEVFGTQDEEFDEETAVREIVALLRRAESRIAQGYTDGELTVSNGDAVGHFKVQLY